MPLTLTFLLLIAEIVVDIASEANDNSVEVENLKEKLRELETKSQNQKSQLESLEIKSKNQSSQIQSQQIACSF